jgi:hypothetical protein
MLAALLEISGAVGVKMVFGGGHVMVVMRAVWEAVSDGKEGEFRKSRVLFIKCSLSHQYPSRLFLDV